MHNIAWHYRNALTTCKPLTLGLDETPPSSSFILVVLHSTMAPKKNLWIFPACHAGKFWKAVLPLIDTITAPEYASNHQVGFLNPPISEWTAPPSSAPGFTPACSARPPAAIICTTTGLPCIPGAVGNVGNSFLDGSFSFFWCWYCSIVSNDKLIDIYIYLYIYNYCIYIY